MSLQMRKLLRLFAAVLGWQLFLALPSSATVDKARCFASIEAVMRFEDEAPCLELAHNRKTSATDRAKILFQVGLAVQEHWQEHKKPFESAWQDAYAYWADAIAADPAYVEPYLAIAVRAGFDDKQKTIDLLDKGLAALPDNPRLKAFKAAVMMYYGPPEQMGKLCDEAVKADPMSPDVASACGDVYDSLGRHVEALASFQNSAKTFDPVKRRRYGMLAESNPFQDMAQIYSKLGDDATAAKTLEAFAAKFETAMMPDIKAELAGYQERAGDYKSAVENYRSAFGHPSAANQRTLVVPYVFALAHAGEVDKALEVSEYFAKQPELKIILMLQVRLKNTVAPHLKINGKYDSATREAMKDCIVSEECEAGFESIRL